MAEKSTIDEDPVLNRGQVASIFGVSTNTIDKWIVKGMPVENQGGNGQAYEFRFSSVQKWHLDNKEKERLEKQAINDFVAKRQAEFLGIKPEDNSSKLTPTQVKELANAQLVYMQAAQKRRSLVSVQEMSDLVESILIETRSAFDGFADWLDRELELTPDQVEKVSAYASQTLSQIEHQITQANLNEELDELDSSQDLLQ